MNIGICGYGNLGRAVESLAKQDKDLNLVAIFSRRDGVKSKRKTLVDKYENAKNYVGKIDVMIMCGGSQEDLEWQSPDMLKYFDVIDTFDTHKRIAEHAENLAKTAKKYKHTAIYSCGWDPGLFSILRTLIANVYNISPITFWGKGVSQGHSEALRNIKGIKDAIQYTIPNQNTLAKLKENPSLKISSNTMHERHCYIVLDGTRKLSDIIKEIKNTENYFKGQKVFVTETTQDILDEMKKEMSHQGIVFGGNKDSKIEFSVKMQQNPLFTARVILAYAQALSKLPYGAYSVLDIPPSLIGSQNNFLFI